MRSWEHSSAGRALALQARGHRFEPCCSHHCLDAFIRRRIITRPACGSDSVVECDLAKVEVAGSNPVFRSIYGKPQKKLFEMFRGAPKEPRVVWGDMRV